MDAHGARRQANLFRSLHRNSGVLLLPCAWDVVSAKLYEEAGFSAIGTTSAGLASTLGYPDGQRIGIEETAGLVRRIAARVKIPVSADIEAGYSDSPEGAASGARIVVEAGASGLNIEDSLSGCGIDHYATLFDAAAQCDRVCAIRGTLDDLGTPAVINARTDVFLLAPTDLAEAADEAIRRGNAYLEAGADCVFVPDMGNLTIDLIRKLAQGIEGPINLIAGENTPNVAQLGELGITRLSFGPRAMRTALWHVQRMAAEWMEKGTYGQMLAGELGYDTVNGWFDESNGSRTSDSGSCETQGG